MLKDIVRCPGNALNYFKCVCSFIFVGGSVWNWYRLCVLHFGQGSCEYLVFCIITQSMFCTDQCPLSIEAWSISKDIVIY